MKVAVVTCYKQPNYVRAVSLRDAVRREGFELIEIKNTTVGIMRYWEVMLRLLMARLRKRPDIYILTFRAYEILLPARIMTLGKPLVYDEFINPYEWLVLEHKKLSSNGVGAKLFLRLYSLLLRTPSAVLTDTTSHANLSSRLTGIPPKRFTTIPVSTDEANFRRPPTRAGASSDRLKVFYYGNMLPLHGLRVAVEAAEALYDKEIDFLFVGGGKRERELCEAARARGANITYRAWIDYEELPHTIASMDLCLAGPFGGTEQGKYVITGKAYQFLHMEKPIVIGENKESHTFSNRQNCLIVKQNNVKSLSKAIEWAATHRKELAEIGLRGKMLYDQKYSNKIVSAMLGDLLRSLAAK